MLHLRLTESTYLRFGELVSQYSQDAAKNGMEILHGDSFGYFTEYDTRSPPWRGCPAGLVSCGVTCDGKVKGCLFMPDELAEGDLRTKDLWEIWFDPDSFQYNRNHSTNMLGGVAENVTKPTSVKGGAHPCHMGQQERFTMTPTAFIA